MDPATPRPRWRVPAAVLAAAALTLTPVPAAVGTTADPAPDPDRVTSVMPAVSTTAVPAPVTPDLADAAVGGQATRAATAAMAGSAESAQSAESAEAAVAEYWTAERMARAIPADGPEGAHPDAAAPGGAGDAVPAPPPEEAPPAVPDGASDDAAEDPDAPTVIVEPVPAADAGQDPRATPVLDYSHTNGKVFFRDQTDGRDYVCSGSAVNSPAGRLVITAGHCVHGGGPGGTWHANWVFAPGYDRGPGREGAFAATSYRTLDDWIDHGASARGFNSDVAFVTTADNDEGETVVEAVGGHGLATGGSREFEASLFGYPTNRDSGERMWACHGRTGTQEVETFRFPSITGCGFGPGSSGGPWLYRYDGGTGLGLVRSVTSFGPAVGNAYVSGPYFDQRVADLYAAANADGSP